MPMNFMINQIKQTGTPTKHYKKRRSYDYDEIKKIVRMRRAGHTYVEIAQKLGRDYPTQVRRIYLQWNEQL